MRHRTVQRQAPDREFHRPAVRPRGLRRHRRIGRGLTCAGRIVRGLGLSRKVMPLVLALALLLGD